MKFNIYLTNNEIESLCFKAYYELERKHSLVKFNTCIAIKKSVINFLEMLQFISIIKDGSIQDILNGCYFIECKRDEDYKITEFNFKKEDVENKNILILDSILDSGKTMQTVCNFVNQFNPKIVYCYTLFARYNYYSVLEGFKYDFAHVLNTQNYIVGFGLDYKKKFRSVCSIYELLEK